MEYHGTKIWHPHHLHDELTRLGRIVEEISTQFLCHWPIKVRNVKDNALHLWIFKSLNVEGVFEYQTRTLERPNNGRVSCHGWRRSNAHNPRSIQDNCRGQDQWSKMLERLFQEIAKFAFVELSSRRRRRHWRRLWLVLIGRSDAKGMARGTSEC